MKYLILVFVIALSLFEVNFASAAEGLVTCTGGNECNFCSFVTMINGIIQWLIIMAVTLSVLLLAFAGFRLVTSAGDAAGFEQAKKIFVSSIIGIMIMLAGWTIVDTALKIAAGGDLGVWNAVECGGSNKSFGTSEINIEEGQTDVVIVAPRETVAEDGPSVVIGSGGGDITPVSGAVSFAFSSSLNLQQQGHLSSTLASLQACVASKIDGGQYIITSVSDNKIANGSKTWAYCAANGQGGGCAHTAGSCHYGGKYCIGKSYAMDIRTSNLNTSQKASVLNAVNACGGWGQNEGNHLHISKGSTCGCR